MKEREATWPKAENISPTRASWAASAFPRRCSPSSAAAAVDVEGVSCLGSGLSSDVTATANRKALTKGVRLWVEDERVTVDLSILVRYGYVVTDVAKAVQEAVFAAVENTSGLEVAQVNVTVVGVTFQK